MILVVYALIISTILLCIGVIDYKKFIIPDPLSYSLWILGFLFHIIYLRTHNFWDVYFFSLIGAALLASVAIVGRVLFGREAMGLGDIKLMRAMSTSMLVYLEALCLEDIPLFPLIIVLMGAVIVGLILSGIFYLLNKNKKSEVDGTCHEDEPSVLTVVGDCLLLTAGFDVFVYVYELLFHQESHPEEDNYIVPGNVIPFGTCLAISSVGYILYVNTLLFFG